MTSKVSSSVDGELIWSSTNLSMRSFVETYQDSLPVLVKTTAGYAGFDESMHQIGSGEVYLVCDIQRQKRIVVQPEKSSCFLSIPTEYPVRVQILQEGSQKMGPPVPVSYVLNELAKRSTNVRMIFENDRPVSFQIGADLGSTSKLGLLTVLQSYEEKYLVANTIFGRSIFLRNLGIPVYLPIEFVTAKERKVGGAKALHLWMKDIMDAMKSYKREPVQMCQELILFSERPSGGEYDYIKLADFSNFKETDKIYSTAIIKRQNPYGMGPEGPTLPKTHPHTTPSSHNYSIELPRCLPPCPPSGQPGPAGGTTSASAPHRSQPGPGGGATSQTPVRQPFPKVRRAPPTPGGSGYPDSQIKFTTRPGYVAVLPRETGRKETYEVLRPEGPAPSSIYQSLSEIPTNDHFADLTIEQVADCLRLLKLGDHVEQFRERHIDGRMALCLTKEMLVREFDFRSFDAIQFTEFAQKGWRPK